MKTLVNNLFVVTSGEEKNPPILFVHGFPFNHEMWEAQIAVLNKNYFCVTYDIRGLGKSDPGDGQFTMDIFADDLNSIIEHLKLNRPIVCGLSMGGYILLHAIGKMQGKLKALILCDTKPSADDNDTKLKRFNAIKRINQGDFNAFITEFVSNCFYEEFISGKKAEFEKVLNRSKQNNPIGVKGCLLAMAARLDTTDILSKIKIPTLIICGTEDKLSPPDVMMAMSDKINGSEFQLIDSAGHMSPIEKPKIVNDAIRNFLKKIK
ncbi:MAG TPA: alpha/beta hydrolase [Ignavibacteriaceae bacterium]